MRRGYHSLGWLLAGALVGCSDVPTEVLKEPDPLWEPDPEDPGGPPDAEETLDAAIPLDSMAGLLETGLPKGAPPGDATSAPDARSDAGTADRGAPDTGRDGNLDGARDVPQDAPRDAPRDGAADAPRDGAPTDAPADTTPTADAGPDPVIVTAGDISSCSNGYDEATARLVDALPGTVLVLGDNVYERGTESEFARCYEPTWGRHRARTRPVVGNHEYGSSGAAPYFRYFGAVAGTPRQGWYSFDLGAWHLLAINSNCEQVGGCNAGSAQERWVRADLAAHPARCTLAFWHHPRFSSGSHGSPLSMNAIWRALYEAGADVVLTGHDHDYERFAPSTAEGRVDLPRGVRQFVVGTGGAGLRSFSTALANSEVRNNTSHGVLRMVLRPDRYEWEFFPVAGRTFTDRGSTPCH